MEYLYMKFEIKIQRKSSLPYEIGWSNQAPWSNAPVRNGIMPNYTDDNDVDE